MGSAPGQGRWRSPLALAAAILGLLLWGPSVRCGGTLARGLDGHGGLVATLTRGDGLWGQGGSSGLSLPWSRLVTPACTRTSGSLARLTCIADVVVSVSVSGSGLLLELVLDLDLDLDLVLV